MKSILLTTTAIVAFAGAAVADGHASVSTALSGKLGYNDTDNPLNASGDDEIGFYWEGNLKTTASAELDNGLTAGAYFEITVAGDDDDINEDGGQDLASSDFVLSLEAENGGLFYGDTGPAGNKYWTSAGDMEADGFTTATDSAILRGDVSIAMVDASLSYIVNDDFEDAAGEEPLQQLAIGAAADFGVVSVAFGYQEDTNFADGNGDFSASEVFGIAASGTFAGATVTLAYADTDFGDKTSTGIKVSAPVGPVTATAYYVEETNDIGGDEDPNFGVKVAYASGPAAVTLDYQDDQGTTIIALDGSYAVNDQLSLFAGFTTKDLESGADYADEYYVAGSYDLGGGASLLIAYAEGDDNADDEIGANDYQAGTTVEVNFSF